MWWWLGWWSLAFSTAALLLPLFVFYGFQLSKWRPENVKSDDTSQPVSTNSVDSQASDSSPLPLPAGEYEVFLSFTGPEVRNNFGDFLYYYLVRSRIRTFRVEEGLHKGERIGPALLEAIYQSKVYIPIFSRNYAFNEVCLKELARMVECCKGRKGHIIFPIFYLVHPMEVQNQTGPFMEAFEAYKKEHDEETIREWRAALDEVGAIKGWHVTASDGQGAIVEDVFSTVWSHLRRDYLLFTDELVGIEHHVDAVIKLLNLDFEGVKIVGIHGMGGIGKTTISMAVYNKVSTYFDRCGFVEDIREILEENEGVVTLQNKLISTVLDMKDGCNIRDTSEGIRMIKDRVCRHKVLICLDDVDHKFDFGKVLGKLDNFSSGSRFIITTRDKKVLNLLKEYESYEPQTMSAEHSLQLFCKHSFGMDYPPEDFETLSRDITSTAAGLPLTLKVVGSSLFGEDKAIWEDTLVQLKETLPEGVQEKLKISYKALKYLEQQIFLDIACFFVGEDKDIPSYMWNDCKFYPVTGINILILKSFIKIGEYNQLRMHDQLRDLGRAIVREENIEQPWKRSRLWANDEALDVLKRKKGTDLVKGFRVSLKSESASQHEITSEQLKNLSDLRYLAANYADLSGNFHELVSNLRWLDLHRYLGNSLVTNFHPKKLVILDLSSSTIKGDWEGWSQIKVIFNLELLNLNGCVNIIQDLGVGVLKNLKVLKLNNCGITKLAADIGQLASLKILIVESPLICHLPASISKLSRLQTLDLQGCPNIQKPADLPASLQKLIITSPVPNLLDLRELKELRLYESDEIEEIPRDICMLSKLEALGLVNSCEGLQCIEELPSSLNILYIGGCPLLKRLPNLANLNNLIELTLSCPKLQEIPGLGELKVLVNLRIHKAFNLQNLDGLSELESLKYLNIKDCESLERLPCLAGLKKMNRLCICRCYCLTEIQGLGELESLDHLDLSDCTSIERLPDLSRLGLLKTLVLDNCERLSSVDCLKALEALESLNLGDCQSIERLPLLSRLGKLEKLVMNDSLHLREIESLEGLESLEKLDVSGCMALERLPDLSGLKNLKELDIGECVKLTELRGLEELQSLRVLKMNDCKSIEKLPNISHLKHLETLCLKGCKKLVEVVGLEELNSLAYLTMTRCLAMQRLPSLANLKKMDTLIISGFPNITEIEGLGELDSLQAVRFDNCTSLQRLHDMSKLTRLKSLSVGGCQSLMALDGLEFLTALERLELTDTQLERLPSLSKLVKLKRINLQGNQNLREIVGIENMERLETLWLAECTSLETLPDLSGLKKLEELNIRGCVKLRS
ncbi:Disease resistance protein L6 [Linum perenne]